MKKTLSITAVIAGALYLAAGIGLLAFQDTVKMAMGYGMDTINVYPAQNVLQLVIIGIPCVALGVLSMSDSVENRRGTDMLLVIYSAIMLVLKGILATIGATISNVIISRTQGFEALANIGMVRSAFNYIQFLMDLSLVLLLLRGALSLGEGRQSQCVI